MEEKAIKVFDAKLVRENLVSWIQQWFHDNGNGCNAVIGISGGKDSSIVAALCVEALGKERVIGVLMPSLKQDDIADSHLLVKSLGIRHYTIPITLPTSAIVQQLFDSEIDVSSQTMLNLPARIRMATLYAVSQSVNGRVANTCNLSEDWVGYSTRYGDGAGDFAPIAKLTVHEVVEIGRLLNIPESLVVKTPSDGLCGETDEDNLGFTYDQLDKYIRTGVCDDVYVREKVDYLHQTYAFKLHMPDAFVPNFSEEGS